MEEILSSIRRIITDDEKGEAQNAAPEAPQVPQATEGTESPESDGEADSQIIDDIARVLSGGAAEVDEEEEILDLTSELGGLDLVEVVEEVEIVEELELVAEIELVDEVAAAPEFVAEPAAAPLSPSVEELAQETAPPAAEASPETPAPLPSAGQEAASVLERAIAALKAGQVPTSTPEPIQFQAAPAPAPEVTPEPLPMAVPMGAQEPSPETHPEPEPLFEPQAEVETSFEAQPKLAPTLEMMPDAEALEVVAEVEVTTLVTEELVELEASDEDVEKAPFWPADMAASEAEATPEATPEALAEPETGPVFDVDPVLKAEPIAKFINGAQRPEGESKTLEDSVKDMLRPMLRQWLDDNMPRMGKDQLGDDVSPGQQD